MVVSYASERVSAVLEGQPLLWSRVRPGRGGSRSGCPPCRQSVRHNGVQTILHDHSGGAQQRQELPVAAVVDSGTREQDPAPERRDQLPTTGKRQREDQIRLCTQPRNTFLQVRPLLQLKLPIFSLSQSLSSYKGNLIKVERSREKQIVDFSTGSPWETVTLTALGRNRQLYSHILDEGERDERREKEQV